MTKNLPAATSSQMVSIDSIDCSPGPYCMSFGYDLNPLILSIQNAGLLNSPILLGSGNSHKMPIIAGYKRIQALKHLGLHTFPCRVLSNATFDPLHGLLMNLYENLSIRKLNDVEKAMVLTRMEDLLPEKTIIEQYLPVLNLAPRRDTFRLYTKMASELGEADKRALAEERLSIQTVKILLDLDKSTRDTILKFFSHLMLNMNQQRQLIDFIMDLAIIENRSVSDLLSDPSIGEIETDSQMNAPQTAKAMMTFFRKRRLPSVVEAERGFKKSVLALKLPAGVRITPPPFFEGSDYRMEISFRDGPQLTKVLHDLSSIKRIARVGNPWEKD